MLWFFFFLLLGLGKESLARTTGWFAILISHFTATIPAFLLLLGRYESSVALALALALGMAALGGSALVMAMVIGRRAGGAAAPAASAIALIVT